MSTRSQMAGGNESKAAPSYLSETFITDDGIEVPPPTRPMGPRRLSRYYVEAADYLRAVGRGDQELPPAPIFMGKVEGLDVKPDPGRALAGLSRMGNISTSEEELDLDFDETQVTVIEDPLGHIEQQILGGEHEVNQPGTEQIDFAAAPLELSGDTDFISIEVISDDKPDHSGSDREADRFNSEPASYTPTRLAQASSAPAPEPASYRPTRLASAPSAPAPEPASYTPTRLAQASSAPAPAPEPASYAPTRLASAPSAPAAEPASYTPTRLAQASSAPAPSASHSYEPPSSASPATAALPVAPLSSEPLPIDPLPTAPLSAVPLPVDSLDTTLLPATPLSDAPLYAAPLPVASSGLHLPTPVRALDAQGLDLTELDEAASFQAKRPLDRGRGGAVEFNGSRENNQYHQGYVADSDDVAQPYEDDFARGYEAPAPSRRNRAATGESRNSRPPASRSTRSTEAAQYTPLDEPRRGAATFAVVGLLLLVAALVIAWVILYS